MSELDDVVADIYASQRAVRATDERQRLLGNWREVKPCKCGHAPAAHRIAAWAVAAWAAECVIQWCSCERFEEAS